MGRTIPTLLILLAVATPVIGEVRETACEPLQVLVTVDRIEVTCGAPTLLGDTGRDSQREIARFAYPMISQSFQPMLGSQVNLVDYYLSQLQAAISSRLRLRIWFETDPGTSHLYGCEVATCRPLVAVAVEQSP